MANINVLSFELANLIAAGEVVDRPASALKELLENAIDAGATAITAEIRRGGIAMIRVSDNGGGMTEEDLPIAIRRHATSKIRAVEDLSAIGTLGFRGEALAAIAAVSELRILTKTRDAESGVMLTSVGGRVTDLSPVGAADGTTVVVENLFENVPARRKFLKKDATETAAATAMIERIAISRPDIAFEWITDGQSRFKTTGDGKLLHALYAVLGRDFAGRLLPVEAEVGGVRVHGYVGTSDNVRGNRNHQNTFINGRYVKSKTVMAALEKAYVSYIASERFPVCALFLDVLPHAVDVNVHPAKLEVKFSDERVIFEAVYYAVRGALEADTGRPEMTLPGAPSPRKNPLSAFVPIGAERGSQLSAADLAPEKKDASRQPTPIGAYTSATRTYSAPSAPVAPPPETDRPAAKSAGEALRNFESFRREAEKSLGEEQKLAAATPVGDVGRAGTMSASVDWNAIFKCTPSTPKEAPLPKEENTPREAVATAEEAKPAPSSPESPIPGEIPTTEEKLYRIIGEAFRVYVIVEIGDELLLIDKHAAHERILFEKLLAEGKRDGRVPSQTLLVPLAVPLGEGEYAAAEEFRGEIEAVGYHFHLDRAARRAELSAIPDGISSVDAEEIFSRMTGELADGSGTPGETEATRRERALYQVACKAAIKGGRLYGEAQIAWLVSRVMALPDITVCPHGRPIAVRLTKNQLDRRFDRIL